jgi:prephenate dehydrogenase
MSQWNRVAIIGVGLIGGSLGLDLLRRRLARHVVGIGRRVANLEIAQARGLVTSTSMSIPAGVAECDLVIVCTPVGDVAGRLLEAAASTPAGCLLTDAGSTKGTIVAELDARLPSAVRFVGSHPLAGSEKAGPQAAVADLFVGRTVVITPTSRTRPADEAAVRELWQSLDARVVSMTPDEHDRVVAATSHLPHLAAAALAAATPAEGAELIARGWLDTTRIAGGDVELWTQIFAANRTHVLTALEQYGKVLDSFRQAIIAGDDAKLRDLLNEAKRARDALGS